jgi:Transcriptional regulator containing an amidase domain and an AraC-type DNA-binding HTH domain
MTLSTLQRDAFEKLICLIEEHWKEIEIISAGLCVDKGWHSPQGKFKAFELDYVSEGKIQVEIGCKKFNVCKGELYLTDLSLLNSCNDSKFHSYYISFGTSNQEIYTLIRQCFNNLNGLVIQAGYLELERHFHEFHTEFSIKRAHNEILVKYGFMVFLVKLLRSMSSQLSNEQTVKLHIRHEKMAESIIEYLNVNCTEHISLNELGKLYSLNPRYLDNVFKKITGMTIIKFLIKLRIEKSKRMLDLTLSNITDIALDTGFNDSQHFCKTFKASEGITPTEYRNRNNG